MAKNLHINLVAFIDPHTHMRRTEPHFNTMVLIENNTFFKNFSIELTAYDVFVIFMAKKYGLQNQKF
jgi:hypothetical protein